MSRTSKTLVALAAAAIVLVIAAWFDTTVMREAQRQAAAYFDPTATAVATMLESLLVAGSVLLVGALAWRAASLVVGLAYVVVGGFFVALPWLAWIVTPRNWDGQPVGLLESLGVAIGTIYFSTAGNLNAVGTIGAAMLIAGIAALALWWRGRAIAADHVEVMDPTADPTLPSGRPTR